MTAGDPPSASSPSSIDTTVPHSARIWNYWLGGKDNYDVDRLAGDEYRKVFPGIVDIARAQRYFLARAVRYLAEEVGIRQFLDIGTGLPTVDNTHDVAQRAAPESRIVYVDNDPLVLLHARALLTSTPEGATDYIDADVRDPQRILDGAARTLDFSRPVAVTMLGVLGHIPDTTQVRGILTHLVSGLCPGSHVVLADSTDTDEAFKAAQQQYNEGGSVAYTLRSPAEIRGFFDGLEVVEPGIVPLPLWRPDLTSMGVDDVDELCGVARKPG